MGKRWGEKPNWARILQRSGRGYGSRIEEKSLGAAMVGTASSPHYWEFAIVQMWVSRPSSDVSCPVLRGKIYPPRLPLMRLATAIIAAELPLTCLDAAIFLSDRRCQLFPRIGE